MQFLSFCVNTRSVQKYCPSTLPPVYTVEHEPQSSVLIQTALPLNSKYLENHSNESGVFSQVPVAFLSLAMKKIEIQIIF